jgi:molybdate transport system substrate-binding protein
METMLNVLSGGAAQGLAEVLADAIRAATGHDLTGDFGPVGGMRDRIVAGASPDLVILSRKLIDDLAAAGHVDPASVTDIGDVATGLALRAGDPDQPCATADEVRALLLASDGVFFPDPVAATAGIHFARVLADLGIADDVAGRLLTFPGGIPAMKAMAASPLARPVGCTQVTEIRRIKGVRLIGLLPPGLDLVTTYTAAVGSRAAYPEAAAQVIALMADPAAAGLRRDVGFAG